jgi:[ribosomal protein S5]-alanine N-acetyltransferase
LETASLSMIPITLHHVEKLIEGSAAFESAYHMPVSDGYLEFPEVLEFWRTEMQDDPSGDEWGTYLIIHRADHALIGLGGFKGAPDAQGRVEIGYGIATAYRGKGYATEAAQAMVDFAFGHPDVASVIAHTMPNENPSTSVLQKVGMVKIGETIDPEDGLLWRWQVNKL